MTTSALDIATFLQAEPCKKNTPITRPASLSNIENHQVTFVTNKSATLPTDLESLFLVPDYMEIPANTEAQFIRCTNPRLAFAKVMSQFFTDKPTSIHPSAIIDNEATIGNGVSIGPYSVIGKHVTIGDNTIIGSHVIIEQNTTIGQHCYIKSTAVIGSDGFGFAFEEDRTPVRIPHIGRVNIGDRVEVGCGTTVARATLDVTQIGHDVKLDDHVHVAHNCDIGNKCIVTACAEISGSVRIGERCWIAPNTSILNKTSIGEDAFIGIGSTVIRPVPAKTKVMGLAAIPILKIVNFMTKYKYGK